jgi:hypothetical protein
MGTGQESAKVINDALLKDIRDAVGSIEYGVITIKVHASKIVQIDVTERKRYDDIWRVEEGAGI